jgi:hypothetical protein
MVIVFFLLSLILLKIFFYKGLTINVIVVSTSLLVLLSIFYDSYKKQIKEPFLATDTTTTEINKIKFLQSLIDSSNLQTNSTSQLKTVQPSTDISKISKELELLITTYDKNSYKGFGSTIYNIAKRNPKTCTSQGTIATRDFNFEDQEPAYSNEKGVFLGNNKLKGPLSLNLGINGNGEFTAFLVCRHDVMPQGKRNINIMNIYANTNNNIGLTFGINEIVSKPVQSAKFYFGYDTQTVISQNFIPIDPNVVYIYFILKKPSQIIGKVMSTINPSPVDIINYKLNNPDVLFSNKVMTINTHKQWYAYLRAFGMYNKILNDEGIKSVYDFVTLQEKKQDELFKQYLEQLTKIAADITLLKKCPYDSLTCQKCGEIKDWSRLENIIGANVDCRTAINTFCTKNPTHSACKCWDTTSSISKTEQCKNYKQIFSGIANIDLTKLDSKSLEYIKKQYNLAPVPKVTTTSTASNKTALSTTDLLPKVSIPTVILPVDEPSTDLLEVEKPLSFWQWLVSWF